MKTRQCIVLFGCFFHTFPGWVCSASVSLFFAVSDTFLPEGNACQKFAMLIKGEGERMGSQFEPHATSNKGKVKPVSCFVLSKRLTIEG